MQDEKDSEYYSREEGLVAVIVGIDGYKGTRPLQCAVNDAVSLSGTLKKVWEKWDIKTLVWPQMKRAGKEEDGYGIPLPKDAGNVTRKNILETVQNCAARCREPDTFIFSFSGHGVLTGGEPTLVTIADGKTAEGIEYLKIREIQQAAASAKCKKKVMILDCCQNVIDDSAEPEGYKNLKELSEDWWIFLSCSPGEASLEDQYSGEFNDDYLQQGIFTASLVEGLRGAAPGSGDWVTLVELASYVGKRVAAEYDVRLNELIKARGENLKGRHPVKLSQNPVLIGNAFAVGGQYQVIMAPRKIPTAQKSKKRWPGKSFMGYWSKYLFGKWPIWFPHKHAFREAGAFLYAAVMFLTVAWHSARAVLTSSSITLWVVVGVGSALLWWFTISFSVAANEERWFTGGYLTSIFYLLWHAIIAWWFWSLFGTEPHPFSGIAKIYYLGIDLFSLLAVVVICGCNAGQTIIAIAETLRPENERGDIRQAIRIFQEFKNRTFGVSLYNYTPMVSAKPVFYYWVFGIALIIVGINTYEVMTVSGADAFSLWVFLLRNMLTLLWVGWLVFWYASAFSLLQKEVYKR